MYFLQDKNDLDVIINQFSHDVKTSLAAIKSGIGGIKDYLPALTESYKIAVKHDLDLPE